jgi:hypothetical protein
MQLLQRSGEDTLRLRMGIILDNRNYWDSMLSEGLYELGKS